MYLGMSCLARKTFKICFTVVCTIVVAFMIGYWFYKYEIEDKDVGVVDYAQLSDEEDIEFPAISLCLVEPFLDEKFIGTGLNDFMYLYVQYLEGELYNVSFEQIDYDNVTIDLTQYFRAATIKWRNGTWRNGGMNLNDLNSFHHHKVFSGFYGQLFFKCFMIIYAGEDQRQIKVLTMLYDLKKLEEDWQGGLGPRMAVISAHYPGQFFLENEFTDMYLDEKQYAVIRFNEYEILKRRNSRQRKCLDVTTAYDKIMVEEFVFDKGCRAPYLEGDASHPLCNTTKKIQDGKITTNQHQQMKVLKACQRTTKITTNIEMFPSNGLLLDITFPHEVRVITQSKDVDIHSLIGNIGGYLGLFLGNKLYLSKFIYDIFIDMNS